MAGIQQQNIRKKAYRFDIKKRYQHVRHYEVKKTNRLDEVRQKLLAAFAPKKEVQKRRLPGKAEPQPAPGFNVPLILGALLIAVLLVAGGLMMFKQSLASAYAPQPLKIIEKATINSKVLSNEVLTSGERGSTQHIGTVLFEYNTTGLSELTVELITHQTVLPTEVFILNTERKEANSYPEFVGNLRKNLAKRNVMMNEIGPAQLETIPDAAIIIVPSGVMPQEMFGVGSNIDMKALMGRGVVIVYIGQSFRSMLDGKLVVNTPANILDGLPLFTDEANAVPSRDGFSLKTPLYTATGRGSGFSSTSTYGSVSIVQYGNGAIALCPQTLDGGWQRNGTQAANDIARIVFETPWSRADGTPKTYGLSSALSGRRLLFTEPYAGTSRSLKMFINGTSNVTGAQIGDYKIVHLRKTQNGEMYVIGGNEVIPTNFSAKELTIYADLKEEKPALPVMYLVITSSANSEAVHAPQGNMNVQAGTTLRFPVYQDTGEYIVSLMDDERRKYADAYLKVNSIEVIDLGINPKKRSEYQFGFRRSGTPETVGSVKVSVDNGKYGEYEFTNVDRIGVDVGSYSGGDMLYGNHTFEFAIGNWKYTHSVYGGTAEKIPLEVVAIIGFAVLIIGIGVVFARKEVPSYMLDIPDFPPVSRTRIPLPSETIVSIFEKVNSSYRWEYTPLTVKEIKSGFKDVFYQGKPIYITDYNIEYLMRELERKKLVEEHLEYYGPVAWVASSKKPMAYLAMMRKLRDVCVTNAAPFTQLGESEAADSEVTVVGQQMFVHFYDGVSDPKQTFLRALASVSKGITVVIFRDEIEKEKFAELLLSSATGPLLMKMEIESSSIQLQSFVEFERMLQEFRGV